MRANYKISDEATRSLEMFGYKYVICWICPPPPRMPVTNEGLGWDSLLKF